MMSALLITACSSIDCELNGKVMCHYTVQDNAGNDAAFAYPLSVTLLRTASDSDTVIINKVNDADGFDLPMSYDQEEDIVKLTLSIPVTEWEDDTTEVVTTLEVNDTIRISKTNTPLFESVDCAPRYGHNITGISFTNNFIDDIVINQSKVSNDASAKNIFIRLKSGNN